MVMTNQPGRPLKHPSECESEEELAELTATAMDRAACGYAHHLYWRKDFQRLARLKKLEQVEQDRIFNELVVSCVVLLMLVHEAPDLRVDEDMKPHMQRIKEALPGAHLNELREMGVKEQHLRDWGELIRLRHEEYAKDRHEVRAAGMELASGDGALDPEDLREIQLMLPLHTVAIGCHDHVVRGESKGRDELFKLILNALGKFYVEFRVRLEGGKITPLDRARVGTRRFFRSLGKK